jgi:class 3 adenylate cyclase/tetratricopeptide (TPR) repeat protein
MTGERKLVTVLFCDIVDSTALAERVGPEAMHRMVNAFFELALMEVHRYEGTINQFLGDGFMALFGAPLANEDHARRATLAALNLRRSLGEGDRTLGSVRASELSVRMGINTGTVVVGTIGDDLRMDYTAVGDTTHLAARLESAARPGSICLSQTTYEEVQDYIECRPRRVQRFKGIIHGVQAYEALSLRSDSEAITESRTRRFSSSLVGRSAEIAVFEGCIENLRRGEGGHLSVTGEPGVGKSRFVAEVHRLVRNTGLTWVEGRAVSYGQSLGYWPFLQVIRGILGITEKDSGTEAWDKLERKAKLLFRAQVAEVVPFLGRLMGLPLPARYEERLQYMEGEAVRRQIFRALRRFFERVAEERALVVILEDWHWADETSREVLDHLLPLVESVPILVCVMSRPQRDGSEAMPPGTREERGQRHAILLSPLPHAEGSQLLQNLLGSEIQPGLRSLLLGRAEGNPFFLEELVRELRDMNALVHDPATGAWRTTMPVEELPLPESLQGVIMARVDRLGDEAKEALKIASVIGRSFFYPVLSALTEREGIDLEHHVADFLRLELIREQSQSAGGRYLFNHALVQEATYGSILLERRAELHRLVANCMEEVFADRMEEAYGLLAFHYAKGEAWQKAQEYLFKAGDQAGRVAADAEALRHYSQALVAYSRVFGDEWNPVHRAMLDRKMGEALFRRGDHYQALEYLRQALATLGSPYPSSLWGVRLGILQQLVIQGFHRVFPRFFMARPGEVPKADAEERSLIYEALGWITYFVDQELFALGTLRHLNLCERSGIQPGWVAGYMALGVILDQLPQRRISSAYHHRGMALAARAQHPVALAFADFGLGCHELHKRCNAKAAFDHYRSAWAAFSESGDFRRWGCSMYFAGWALRLMGEVEESLTLHREAARAGEDAGDHHVWGWGLHGIGRTLWQRGRPDEAVGKLELAIELFESVPDYQLVMCAKGDLGRCYLRQGKLDEAVAVLEESRDTIESKRFHGAFCTETRNALAEAYLAAAEQAEGSARRAALRKAKAACRAALRHSRVNPEGGPGARRLQGTYEWLRGKPARAERWWRRALAAAEALESSFEQAETLREIGKRTGDTRSIEQADALLKPIGEQAAAPAARSTFVRPPTRGEPHISAP